jgi:hypothetical protein
MKTILPGGWMVATSLTLVGYMMFHVSVGLVPVWTMVGKAVNVPIGVIGMAVCAVAAAVIAANAARDTLVGPKSRIGFITGWIGFGFGRKLRLG